MRDFFATGFAMVPARVTGSSRGLRTRNLRSERLFAECPLDLASSSVVVSSSQIRWTPGFVGSDVFLPLFRWFEGSVRADLQVD